MRTKKKLTLSKMKPLAIKEKILLKFLMDYQKTSPKPPTPTQIFEATGIKLNEINVYKGRLEEKRIVKYGMKKSYYFKPLENFIEAGMLIGYFPKRETN